MAECTPYVACIMAYTCASLTSKEELSINKSHLKFELALYDSHVVISEWIFGDELWE